MAATVTTTLLLLAATMYAAVSCGAAALDSAVPTVSFDEGFTTLFGEANMARSFSSSSGADVVRITLDRRSGSGFISKQYYHHGLFSADIRLPASFSTAGVVVAFYLSNGDAFPDTHDELDFEFLGDRAGRPWRLQTNVYGNGSTARGREERYLMPFDPAAAAAHNFAVSWSPRAVVFSVDGVPIREVLRHKGGNNGDMGGDFPSKPMAVYATIWDGSTWATENGKYKVDYEHGPFTAEFSRLVLHGCVAAAEGDIGGCAAAAGPETETMTMAPWEHAAMRRWRSRQTLYTVCYDADRYPAALPECETDAAELRMFERWGESKRLRQLQLQGQAQAPPSLVSLQQVD